MRTRRGGATDRPAIAVSAEGCVSIHHRRLFGNRADARRRQVLARLFSVAEVVRVAIRPAAAVGEIQFAAGSARLRSGLRGLAAALHDAALEDDASPPDCAEFDRLHLGSELDTVSVFRDGGVLTTWRVVHELAGRIRLKHSAIQRRKLGAAVLEHEFRLLTGILDARANPATGSLLLQFDPELIDRTSILEFAEVALVASVAGRPAGYQHPAQGLRAANTTLAVASIGHFVFPPFLVLSAGMLICNGLDQLDIAWREVGLRRIGAPAVRATVTVLTLGTGSFFGAAVALWMIEFWDRTYHQRLGVAQRRMLAHLGRRSRRVTALREGAWHPSLVAELHAGDEVRIRRGDVVPGDAVVLEGECTVLDQFDRGNGSAAATIRVGDALPAGSIVTVGQTRLRLTRCGHQTRSAGLLRAVEMVTSPTPSALVVRGAEFAERAAAMTLGIAALTFLIGGPTAALAVLRTDFASGPGMVVPLATLHAVADWLDHGIVLCDREAVQRLKRIDAIVLDVSACIVGCAGGLTAGAPKLVGLVRRLRSMGIRVGVMPQGLGSSIGADFELDGSTPAQHAEHLARLRDRGLRVAFAGDCLRDQEVARAATLAISLDGTEPPAEGTAHVWVRSGRWAELDVLWSTLARQRAAARRQLACILIPNGICMVGAALFGITPLTTIMLTNLGTGWGYQRHLRDLRRLERWSHPLASVRDAGGDGANGVGSNGNGSS